MERWSLVALAVAAVMIAGPAFAQSTGSGATPQKEQTPAPAAPTPTRGDGMKQDTMKSDAPRTTRAGRAGNREQVKAAQETLKQKGFDPGPADGMMGPQTRAALKDFQRAEKMNETGRLDAETMAKLGVQAKGDSAGPAASPRTDDTAKPSGSKPSEKDATAPKKQNP